MARREKRIPDYGNAPTLARAGGRLAGRTARCSPYYGIALSTDALALSLENERMVYASMYGKENGTFTDKDILSAKKGTRASAFFFALSIMGASEAIRAWKLLSKYNNLIPPVQDGLASMKNGRALLESLSPNELSRLSQFRSDDVIYSLMDNMKNGKIGGGITLDEYINIRQQGAKSVGVVGRGTKPAEDILRPGGKLLGEAGTGSKIRILQGSADDAAKLFDDLAAGGKPITGTSYPGRMVELPGGGVVKIRPSGTSGNFPTIDVDIPGIGVREIKFKP